MSSSSASSSSMPASFINPESVMDALPISPERRTLLTRLKNDKLSNLRPPSEFFDRERFSKPSGMVDITQRLSYNLTYFQSNYILVVLGLLIYCLITNFWLLFTIIFLVFGLNFIRKLPPNEPFVFQSFVITQKQLYSGLIFISVPLLWISSAGSAIFWIVGASAVLVLGHAAFLAPGVDSQFNQV